MASKPPDAVATAWRNGENRFSGALVALHWATLLLVAAAYACIELRELYPKGSDPREMLKAWHYALGMSVLVLTALRIAMAAVGGAQPPVHPAPPRWQRGAAAVMHAALYAFLVAMPVLGWWALSLKGDAVSLAGLELPSIAATDRDFGKTVQDWHATFGLAGYWIIGLHAAAALFHHYVQRDDTLRRMLPGRP